MSSYLTVGLEDQRVDSGLLPTILSEEIVGLLGLKHAFKDAGVGFRMLAIRSASLAKYAKYHGTTWREVRADTGLMLELVPEDPMGGDLSQLKERLKPTEEVCLEKRVQDHMDADLDLREQVSQLQEDLGEIYQLLNDPHVINDRVMTNPLIPDPGNYVNGPEFSLAARDKDKAAPAKVKTPKVPTTKQPKAPRKVPKDKKELAPSSDNQADNPSKKKPSGTPVQPGDSGFSLVDEVPGDVVEPSKPEADGNQLDIEPVSGPIPDNQFELTPDSTQESVEPGEQSDVQNATLITDEQKSAIVDGFEYEPGNPLPQLTVAAQNAIHSYNGQLVSAYGMQRSAKKSGTGVIHMMAGGLSSSTMFSGGASNGATAYYNTDGSIAIQEGIAQGLKNYAGSDPKEIGAKYSTILKPGKKSPGDPDLYNPLNSFHIMLHETVHDHGPRMVPLEGAGLLFEELCTELASRKITADKHGLRLAAINGAYQDMIQTVETALSSHAPEPKDLKKEDPNYLDLWDERQRDSIHDAMSSAALAIKSHKAKELSPTDAIAMFVQHLAEKLGVDQTQPVDGYPSFSAKMDQRLTQLMNW